MNDRESARRATIIAYKNRVCSEMKLADGRPILPPGKVLYQGQFPYQETADTVAAPKTGDPSDHKKQWDELYNNFAIVWHKFRDAA